MKMKMLALAAIALASVASGASALDIGQTGVTLDNTTAAEWSVETSELTATHTFNLNYTLPSDVKLYAETEVDLTDAAFAGLDTGLEYAVDGVGESLVLDAHVSWDEDLKYTDTFVGMELKF